MRLKANWIKSKKNLGIGISCVVVLVFGAGIIANASRLQLNFDPGDFLQNTDKNNDVAYDSTVFGANQGNSDDSKEVDEKASEEYSIDEGEENIDDTTQKPDNTIQLVDTNSTNTNENNNSNTTSGTVLQIKPSDGTGQSIVVVEGSGDNTEGTHAGAASDSGNGTTLGNEGVLPGGENSVNGDNPGDSDNPGGNQTKPEDPEWVMQGFHVVIKDETGRINIYQYLTLTDSFVQDELEVTSTWQNINDPTETKTVEETGYTISGIPEEFQGQLTKEDVGKTFTFTVSLGEFSEQIPCMVMADYIKYDRISVNYSSDLKFYVGENIDNQLAADKIAGVIDVTGYGYTLNGRNRVTVYHYQNSGDLSIEFKGTEAAKDVTKAGLLLKNDDLKYTTFQDAVSYQVFNHKLTVMYDGSEILQEIYTDSNTVDLTKSYDGMCPYNNMIDRLTKAGLYQTSENGYLQSIFYGWSMYADTTDKKDAITTFTFLKNTGIQTLYPLPLAQNESSEYLVKQSGSDQILVGYTGMDSVLNIPYGVTKVVFDASFSVNSLAGDSVRTIVFPATVKEIDFSAVLKKFPKLTNYLAVNNTNYSTDGNGVIYQDAGATLLRTPVNAKDVIMVSENVTKIVSNAFDDSLAYNKKKSQTLVLQMEGMLPPEFQIKENAYAEEKNCLKIQVPDMTSKVEDICLKQYGSAWGSMLDQAFGESGYAYKSVLYTESGAQTKYWNDGNIIYSGTKIAPVLEYVPAGITETYNIPEGVTKVASYAFFHANQLRVIEVPDSVISLEDSCFEINGENNLLAIHIAGNQKIQLGRKLIGENNTKKINGNLHIFVSEAQSLASSWEKNLTADYTKEETLKILVITDGRLLVEENAVYMENTEDNTLTLYTVSRDLTEYVAPQNLVNITEDAFEGCSKLEILVLPKKEKITSEADFSDCTSLKMVLCSEDIELNLPENVTKFTDEQYFEENTLIYKSIDTEEKTSYEVMLAPTDIAGEISLKENTESIAEKAFLNCSNLTGFGQEQWNEITAIGNQAFDGCTSLAANLDGRVELSAETIGESAFYGCTGIKELYLNPSVTKIGTEAFVGCNSLQYLYWRAYTSSVGDRVFAESPLLSYVVFGDETLGQDNTVIEEMGTATFQNCTSLLGVSFYASVKNIGDYAFDGCTNMTQQSERYEDDTYSVAKIEHIGKYAFRNCNMLVTSLSTFDGLTSMGEGAFQNCSSLIDLALPENVKEIPDYCFAGCSNAKAIYTADCIVESIGTATFTGCTSLRKVYDIETKENLKEIGAYAFSEYEIDGVQYGACSLLDSIGLPSHLTTIGEYAFYNNTSLATVNWTRAIRVAEIGIGAFENCIRLEDVQLNNTKITVLGADVYKGCETLSTLTLPGSLKSIESGALDGCENLSTILMKNDNDIVTLGENVFGESETNEALILYVPYMEDHHILQEYLSDEKWMNVLQGREEAVQEIQDSIILRNGIYDINEDGTYTLTGVLPNTTGAFAASTNMTAILPGAFEGADGISMISLPDSITELPAGIFEPCTGLEALILSDESEKPLTVENNDLFGNATPNEHFRVYTTDERVDSYPDWEGIDVRSYGDTFEIINNVLYKQIDLTPEMIQAGYTRMMNLIYIPYSYEGVLNVYSSTAEIEAEVGMNHTKITAVECSNRVYVIGDRAFKGCTALESVFLPNTTSTRLQSIGEEAFADCTSLVGRNATSAVRLTIPTTVKTIGKAAFKNCSSLSYVSVQCNLQELSDEVFSGCTSLATYTGTAAGLASIERIGKKAFYNCTAVTSISWTNMTNLTEVDDSAYEGCTNLILATFADKLERIGDRAFQGTNLQSISFNGTIAPLLGKDVMTEDIQQNITIYVPLGVIGNQVLVNYENAWSNDYPILAGKVQGLNAKVFRMVSNVLYMVNPESAAQLTVIKVPRTLSAATFYNASSLYCIGIADDALRGCDLLSTITLTANIKTIGNRAFEDCTGLKTVTVSTKLLTSIGDEAFKNCEKLQSLILPDTMESLGSYAFDGAAEFTYLKVNNAVPFALGEKIFGDSIPEGIQIEVPAASYDLYMERWGAILDRDYGEGTGALVLIQGPEGETVSE